LVNNIKKMASIDVHEGEGAEKGVEGQGLLDGE
jgi:hypothetical protein